MRFFNTKKWHSDNGPVSPPATFPRDQRHLPSTPQRISEVTATWAELNPLFTASRLNKSRYWENWIKSGINSQTLKQITWALLAVRNSPPKADSGSVCKHGLHVYAKSLVFAWCQHPQERVPWENRFWSLEFKAKPRGVWPSDQRLLASIENQGYKVP